MIIMKKIIAIGGGEIKTRETILIDREIIKLSGKKKPKLLFVPTASLDSESYWKDIQKYFGKYLGCRTDVLFLVKQHPSQRVIKKKIFSADIIYVGGGNTLKMMTIWRRLGVDNLLKAAYQKGILLCGLSAGSICWFESGHSDSMAFYNPKKWKYINVKGLGLIKGINCPHYNNQTFGVKRRKHFQNMIYKVGGFGIAIDNSCAIEFLDGKYYKVLTSKKNAGAYRVYKKHGKIFSKKIEKRKNFAPIDELYKK